MAYLKQGEKALPMVAPVAVQQGRHAARSILRRERGLPVRPFRYWHMGLMAVVGRTHGAAYLGGLTFTGFLGWLVWFGFHLAYLIGWGNRGAVLFGWLESLLSARRIRGIVREREQLRKALRTGEPGM
jgi:NADH dehydrogenase